MGQCERISGRLSLLSWDMDIEAGYKNPPSTNFPNLPGPVFLRKQIIFSTAATSTTSHRYHVFRFIFEFRFRLRCSTPSPRS